MHMSKIPEMPTLSEELTIARVQALYRSVVSQYNGTLPSKLSVSSQGLIIERRQQRVTAPRQAVFRAFVSLGGEHGWLFANWLWHLRGFLDRLFGGIGFRRGRPKQRDLRLRDKIDFFTVDALQPDQSLVLKTDFKVPGQGWLQFEALPTGPSESSFVLTAFFIPRGRFGWLYWHLLHPVHSFVFWGMSKALAKVAESSR
jgi:hypothetical protein